MSELLIKALVGEYQDTLQMHVQVASELAEVQYQLGVMRARLVQGYTYIGKDVASRELERIAVLANSSDVVKLEAEERRLVSELASKEADVQTAYQCIQLWRAFWRRAGSGDD